MSFEQFLEAFENDRGRVVIQLLVGRAGSLFVQSLLDGHPNVLMYPGIVNFYRDTVPALRKTALPWQEVLRNTLNKMNRTMVDYNVHRNLGADASQTIDIEVDTIVTMTERAIGDRAVSSRTLFLAFHYAVATYFGQPLSDVHVVYCHEHTVKLPDRMLKTILADFPSAILLCIVRDPRSNYLSVVAREREMTKAWLAADGFVKYSDSRVRGKSIEWFVTALESIVRFRKNFLLVRLEDFQNGHEAYVRGFAERLGIPFRASLMETTFQGKLWGGDRFSARQPGFRNSTAVEKWRADLSAWRQSVLELLLAPELRILGYPMFYKDKTTWNRLVRLTLPLWSIEDVRRFFMLGLYRKADLKGPAFWKQVGHNYRTYCRYLSEDRRLAGRPERAPDALDVQLLPPAPATATAGAPEETALAPSQHRVTNQELSPTV